LIADLAHRAVGKRHGRYGWLAVAAGIVVGALVVGVVPMLLGALMLLSQPQIAEEVPVGIGLLGAMGGMFSIGWWVYVVAAVIAAVGRLRMGK